MDYLRRLKIEFVKGEFKNPVKGQVRAPEHVYAVFRDIKDWAKETAIGIYLNEKMEINSYEIHSVGSAFETVVLPDEIFRNAILTNSRNFILIHNHPSGEPSPSEEDRNMMRLLKQQASIMHRSFLDFIIVGEDTYWSMFESEEGGEYIL